MHLLFFYLNKSISLFQADIVNSHEYRGWRSTGVAFEVREGDYDVPNKTLASGLILTHVRFYVLI